ncbi:MAG: membrane dipeptidase [Clostridia bacterium]|nr:membrane dipeptidase [Clostridia bacterium]
MELFDLHCDTPYRCYTENIDFWDARLAVSGKKGEVLSNWRQCFAIWIREEVQNPYNFYKSVLCDFRRKLISKPCNLTPYFTLEGGSVIDSTDMLYELKNDGIRAINLTWNGENRIAGGVNTDKGLTEFGAGVIKAMNSLKIFCDLSHLNQKSFYKAIELSDYPFASHSNCSEICPHPRNLSDRQLKAIGERGGIIGLCFYPEFSENDVFEGIYRNIYHILNLGLENNIAIGSDFDGADMAEKLNGTDKILALYRFLEGKNIEKELLYKIFYGNAVKFFDK